MKEVKVNVAMPSKVQGLKSLNDTQKAVWLGSAANGAIELLNGASIPISDDLQKLQLPVHKICTEKVDARGRTAQKWRMTWTSWKSLISNPSLMSK